MAEEKIEHTSNGVHDHRHHIPFNDQHHHRQRLVEFFHPHTGKTIHVVHHPHEIESKRKELSEDQEKLNKDYDIVVYGSPEHISTIRDLHDHHNSRREAIRLKNSELFEEFDDVHHTLDNLADELHQLTEHAVSLDASFNKFGYSARIRTKDESETNSLEPTKSAQEKAQDRSVEPFRFWKTPVIRQYFHKGLLWRSSQSGEVGSFELFVDLLYVGVIDAIGEAAVTNASGISFLHFVIIYSIGFKIWSDMTMVVNWFEVEDVFGRLSILFILCCLYGFNSNIEYFFESTLTSGVAFYLTQRLFLAVWFIVASFLVPMINGSLLTHAFVAFIAAALWIAFIHIEWPYSLIAAFPAIIIDLLGGVAIIFFTRYAKSAPRLTKYFEFYPAINIEHRTERTSSFMCLIFGYSVLMTLFQSSASFGINAFFGKGILALVQAYTIMWIYFEVDALPIHVHAIRRHWFSSSIWITIHLPLSGAFILASSTLSELVVAHDCPDANAEDLAERYAAESFEEVHQPFRWFYCAGLAVSLFCMTLISFCHIHKKTNRPRLRKRTRLVVRICVSIILVLLPLAHELNSLDLISITTALFIFVLIVDLYGMSCADDDFWMGVLSKRCNETRCNYSANVKMGSKRRKALQEKLARGENICLNDALKRENTGSTSSISTQETLLGDADWHGGHV